MPVLDHASVIRQGEELDLSVLEKIIKAGIPGLDGPLSLKQFPAGHSNLTYLLTVGSRDMVLRRPPFGTKAKTAHDMGREYRVLQGLKDTFPYCPEPLLYVEDESLIGYSFYIMERLKGIILRKELPADLNLTPNDMKQLCDALIDVQVELHTLDYQTIGLEHLGKPEGYTQRQIEGWSKRYIAARTEDVPGFEQVMRWLSDHLPAEPLPVSIIHNDYKFDNVVLDPENPLKIIGVLDWEMATLGNPLMDFGSSLAYWIQQDDPDYMQALRMMPTHQAGALTRQQLIQRYAERSGISIENFDFYYCFGLFRLAGIAQQIYYRFYHGQTQDKRFQAMGKMVTILEKVALAVIQNSRL